MPYMLVTRAIPNGLARKGTDLPNIARLPQSSPAAPAPEITLPTINAAEFGAAALRIEPPSTGQNNVISYHVHQIEFGINLHTMIDIK